MKLLLSAMLSAVPLALIAALAGCGPPPCPTEATDVEGSPEVTEFAVHSQLDGDPWTVIFAVGFTDADGDLGDGTAEFFLNGGNAATTIELFDLFRQSGLGVEATSGRIAIPLRFREDVRDGASVRIGVQVIDAADHRSNCYSLELSFDVEPLARVVECRPTAAPG